MSEEQGKQGVAALERALSIVDAFRSGSNAKTLTELSSVTGLYKSTILRLCVSLEKFGYLTRLDSGKFTLGSAVFELGEIYQRTFPYAKAIKPLLTELARKTQESATFWILADDLRVCLLRVDSPQPVRDASIREGDRLPLDQGATSDVFRRFAAEVDLDSLTPDALFGISIGGYQEHLAGIACPVFVSGGKLAGAITIAGPTNRFPPETIETYLPLLLETCGRATEILGGPPRFYRA